MQLQLFRIAAFWKSVPLTDLSWGTSSDRSYRPFHGVSNEWIWISKNPKTHRIQDDSCIEMYGAIFTHIYHQNQRRQIYHTWILYESYLRVDPIWVILEGSDGWSQFVDNHLGSKLRRKSPREKKQYAKHVTGKEQPEIEEYSPYCPI